MITFLKLADMLEATSTTIELNAFIKKEAAAKSKVTMMLMPNLSTHGNHLAVGDTTCFIYHTFYRSTYYLHHISIFTSVFTSQPTWGNCPFHSPCRKVLDLLRRLWQRDGAPKTGECWECWNLERES